MEAERNGAGLLLRVRDDGAGIPSDVISRVFEPHFSTKEGGTGLGLAIVKRIVTDHGGFVRGVASQPKGTRFVLEFPDTVSVRPEGMVALSRSESGSQADISH